MSGPIVFNTDLSANPPHTGKGDGEATITQTGVCKVVSDSQGNVSTTPTLALMAAGVPIKRPVAGISAGLVTNPEDEDDFITFKLFYS